MSDPRRAARMEGLRAMLEADPDDAFALYGLALEQRAEDEVEAAEALLRRLLVVEPGHLYGYFQLGELLLDEGRPDEAAPLLREGVQRAEAVADGKAAREIGGLLARC